MRVGVLDRARGLFRRERAIEQADRDAAGIVTTPYPIDLDEVGQPQTDINTMMRVRVPDPDHIELMCLVSHEVASTIKRVRSLVWRARLRIEPRFQYRCTACGHETDETPERAAPPKAQGDALTALAAQAPRAGLADSMCPACGVVGTMREPDEREKVLLERFRTNVDQQGTDLEELGRDLEDDGNKHDWFFPVFRFSYDLHPTGHIAASYLKELRRGDPRTFRQVKDKGGRIGGRWFVCLRCRAAGDYQPETTRQPCSACGGATYDATFIETTASGSETPRAYYITGEVLGGNLHYRGTSPLARIWDKAVALVWMDKYVNYAFDPRRDKRPEKIGVIVGGDKDTIKKWAKEDAERRRKNPYAFSWLHLPIVGSGAEARPDLKVVDLGDVELKQQGEEIRNRYERQIRIEYGLSNLDGGDTSSSGGLNNEGHQLRTTAQTVQAHQQQHQRWLDKIADALGCQDYRYAFGDALEEDNAVDADGLIKQLEVAEKATSLGLSVKWHDGRAIIGDGAVEKRNPPIELPPGLGGAGRGQPDEPDAEMTGAVPEVEQAAASNKLPKYLRSAFREPSRVDTVAEAQYEAYSGLSAELTQAINEEILESMTQPQGWSTRSIAARIEPLLAEAGVPHARERANLIARTESAALESEMRLRLIRESEARRGRQDLYRTIGPDDHRRTRMSRWLAEQTRDGVPLDQLEQLMDEAVNLAKRGAFTDQGELSSIEGEPITLPPDFRRRGFVAHFQDRDVVVRVRKGAA